MHSSGGEFSSERGIGGQRGNHAQRSEWNSIRRVCFNERA